MKNLTFIIALLQLLTFTFTSEITYLTREYEQCHYAKSIQYQISHSNEDRYVIASVQKDGHIYKLYAIFDGHSGEEVSNYLQSHFVEAFAVKLTGTTKFDVLSMKMLLFHLVLDIDENICSMEFKSGSTGVVVLIVDNKHVFSVNVGDSQAFVIGDGNVLLETKPHKPENHHEKRRIEKKGGTVENVYGYYRVNGKFSLSRAFGDCEFKRNSNSNVYIPHGWISVHPEIEYDELPLQGKIQIFLGSDGIFDVLSVNEITEIVNKSKESPEKISFLVVLTAIERRANDDLTAIYDEIELNN